MMGWPVWWKCLVAWRWGELSQQPTCPQMRQSRKCTQREPIFRHSSQPSALGVTLRIAETCAHPSLIASSGAIAVVSRGFRKIFVQRRDHLRAFADGSCDALYRAGPHVTDGKYTGSAGFEWTLARAERGPREHEALRIHGNVALPEPFGIGLGANKQKQVPDFARRLRAGGAISPPDPFQHAVGAREPDRFGFRNNVDIFECGDALDEIARHAGFQVAAAHDQAHFCSLCRKVNS